MLILHMVGILDLNRCGELLQGGHCTMLYMVHSTRVGKDDGASWGVVCNVNQVVPAGESWGC